QHVLDPLLGYLILSERLASRGHAVAEAWNFGPDAESDLPVRKIVDELAKRWGGKAAWELDRAQHPHEAAYLRLDCAKAMAGLGWRPSVAIAEALDMTVEWYRVYQQRGDVRNVTLTQIRKYLA